MQPRNGIIRLVNPWRGLLYVSEIKGRHGLLSARTQDFKMFSIYFLRDGVEFYPGRMFDRVELSQWLSGEPIHPDSREVLADEFGAIPAVAPNPQSWKWYAFRQGEEILKYQFSPSTAEIQKVAGAALMLRPDCFSPLIDPWEIWVCDKDSQLPLMLTMTGQSLEDIDSVTFSPLWRFNWQTATTDTEPMLRALEKRVNERINAATEPGRVRWTHRLFRRNLDGSAEEWRRENECDPSLPLVKVEEFPAGWLPSGLLAEPFESDRRALEGALEVF